MPVVDPKKYDRESAKLQKRREAFQRELERTTKGLQDGQPVGSTGAAVTDEGKGVGQ